jgi:hypothetical protein
MKKVKASDLQVGNIVRDCDGCVFEVHDLDKRGNMTTTPKDILNLTYDSDTRYRLHWRYDGAEAGTGTY